MDVIRDEIGDNYCLSVVRSCEAAPVIKTILSTMQFLTQCSFYKNAGGARGERQRHICSPFIMLTLFIGSECFSVIGRVPSRAIEFKSDNIAEVPFVA
jgi:hypothetical protein